MQNKLISSYKNGNYEVLLYEDGTKIKQTEFDDFCADFPDSMDLKITDYCDRNCPMCHERSSQNGKHGNLAEPFLDTLMAGTELAIGGGNPLSHPDVVSFLQRMKDRKIVCNMTVNEEHLLQNEDKLQSLIDNRLVWGVGISLTRIDEKTIAFASKNKNVVFHLINGLDYKLEKLYDKGFKILILGYKKFGRGKEYFSQSIAKRMLKFRSELLSVMDRFAVVSFDNLALKQLCVKRQIGNNSFKQGFMGNDGECTMYVDLVKRQFALSSTSTTRYNLLDDVKEMFNVIKVTK